MTQTLVLQIEMTCVLLFLGLVLLIGIAWAVGILRNKVAGDTWMIALFFLLFGGCGLLTAWFQSLPK